MPDADCARFGSRIWLSIVLKSFDLILQLDDVDRRRLQEHLIGPAQSLLAHLAAEHDHTEDLTHVELARTSYISRTRNLADGEQWLYQHSHPQPKHQHYHVRIGCDRISPNRS